RRLAAVDIADFKGAARLPELLSVSPLIKSLPLAQPTQRLAVRKICNRSGRLALNHILVLALLILRLCEPHAQRPSRRPPSGEILGDRFRNRTELLIYTRHAVRIASRRRRAVRVAIVDETSSLGEAARRALSSVGAAATLTGPLRELPLAFDARKTPDLLIVNVTNGLTGWEVAARIERSGYRGRVLAFVDALDDAEIQYLTRLPDVECVARPSSTAQPDDRLAHPLRATRLDTRRSLAAIPSAYDGITEQSPPT